LLLDLRIQPLREREPRVTASDPPRVSRCCNTARSVQKSQKERTYSEKPFLQDVQDYD